jgi:hypothetical protein
MFDPHSTNDVITSQFWANGSQTPVQFGPDMVCNGMVLKGNGASIDSIGKISIVSAGVEIDYPLYCPAKLEQERMLPVILTSHDNKEVLVVAGSPEKLPKISSDPSISAGRIDNEDKFRRLLKMVESEAEDVAFIDSESECGRETRTSVKFYLACIDDSVK